MANYKALLVGINYVGTPDELRGCVNDVNTMKGIIESNFGFTNPANIKVLTDSKATTQNILNGLEWLVSGAAAGDVLLFHYSGHGSQVPDGLDGDYEPDSLDEIICPIDLDWQYNIIRDDQMKEIFDRVPAGCSLTVILDCCHSGGALDQDNQYQPLGEGVARNISSKPFRNRYIPMPPSLYASVSRRRKLKVNKRTLLAKSVQKNGVLITGCQSQQTSADAWIGGKFMGAATYYIAEVLKHYNYNVSYKVLVDEINNRLKAEGYTQRPELNGNKALFENGVLYPNGVATPVNTPVASPQPIPKASFWSVIQSFFEMLFNKLFKRK